MVGDRLVIRIPGLPDRLPCISPEDLLRKGRERFIVRKSAQISADHLRDSRRQDTGIGSRIRGQLLLVQLLGYFQRLVR